MNRDSCPALSSSKETVVPASLYCRIVSVNAAFPRGPRSAPNQIRFRKVALPQLVQRTPAVHDRARGCRVLWTICDVGAWSTASRKTGAAFTPQASRSRTMNCASIDSSPHVPSHVASTPQARATTAEFDALPPRHRLILDARQHVSSVGYLSTLATTSTHANPQTARRPRVL